ncbi:MAG: DUF559 domain-containing protein, partial [Nitrospinae bacterium]|nr:DUF559 domain-containing protein [Nitrospinota bacterium]
MTDLTEGAIEQNLIDLLKNQGYQYFHGSTIAPNADNPQREGFHSVVLEKQFKASLRKINPELPESARHEAYLHVLNLGSNDIMTNNEKFHLMLTNGVTVEYFKEGQSIGLQVKLIDFKNPNNNDFWVVNQFVIQENNQSKRLDVVLFVNGLPLVVVELKSAISEKATLERAYTQIQNYKSAIPSIFFYNALCIISDGIDARISSVSAPFSRFLAWKSPQQEENGILPELQIMANEMLQKEVLLKLIRFNTVFEKSIELIPSLNPSHGEGEHYRGGMQFTGMIKQVRELRKKQTNAENIFWELVRNKKFCGLKFRRQHQIGHYIADFYCHSERLVIEFDGEVHCTAEQQKKDKKRDKYLTSLGNSVLRFNNTELFDNPAGVLQRIEKSLSPFGRDGREGSKPTIEGSTTQVVTIKKIAAYHQYYVVEKAIESTLRAINIKAPVGGNVTVLRENP